MRRERSVVRNGRTLWFKRLPIGGDNIILAFCVWNVQIHRIATCLIDTTLATNCIIFCGWGPA